MARSPQAIVLSVAERAELERRAACYTRPYREVQRAKIVLYAAEGISNVEIATRLDTAPEVVGRWRKRFHEEGFEGLADRARAGRPGRFSPGGSRAGEGDRLRVAARARRPALALLAR
jgi:hypothetical protein